MSDEKPIELQNPVREFIYNSVSDHSEHILKVTADKFGISKQAVSKHMHVLIDANLILQSRAKSRVTYSRPDLFKKKILLDTLGMDESKVWQQHFSLLDAGLRANVSEICYHGFCEMLNNVIDHSGSDIASVETNVVGDRLTFLIVDSGIGAFRKIQQTLALPDIRDSVLELTKGKRTSDPSNHSGQGIFFTSKMFDTFTLISNGIGYFRDNLKQDWWIQNESDRARSGTGVRLELSVNSTRTAKSVYEEFQSANSLKFNKTNIAVDLSLYDGEKLVSRSQAKKILYQLEEFEHVVLDFKKVQIVGQAFVDEVFRVYRIRNPKLKITWINANDEVTFMINRGLTEIAE